MTAFDAFRRDLDRMAAEKRRLRLWLRDDDAVAPGPALDRLLALTAAADVPLLIASIPESLQPALAERLADQPQVALAVHGWAHRSHAPAGQKSAELGAHRPVSQMLAELREGQRRLQAAFGPRLLPMLVPPWNRIAPELVAALPQAGFAALSVFGREKPGPVPMINTHVDIIDWRGSRGGRPVGALLDEIRDWIAAPPPAIGILSHHLVHDAAAWEFLEGFLALTARHPAVEWVSAGALIAEAQRAGG